MTPTTDAPRPKTDVPRWRRVLAAVLVVLACVLAPVSLLAVWTRNTLLDTDQYVETMAPLAEDEAIIERTAEVTSQSIRRGINLTQEFAEVLPDRAKVAAPVLARAAEQLIDQLTLRFLESDAFQNIWETANRRAHSQIVAVLTGEGRSVGRVEAQGGKVIVHLGPVVQKVRDKLENLGVDVFADAQGRRVTNQIVLFEAEDLQSVQGAVDVLDTAATILPFLALILLAAGLALSPNRRRTLLRAALGIAAGMALVLIVFNVLRDFYLDVFKEEGREAAGNAYDQILSFLRLSARTALAVSLVVALCAWLAGPGRVATRVRERYRRLMERDGGEVTPVSAFVARHRTALHATVIGLGALVLVIVSAPTPLLVLVIAVLVGLGLLTVELLARAARSAATPPAG
jgi:hypothetical protein